MTSTEDQVGVAAHRDGALLRIEVEDPGGVVGGDLGDPLERHAPAVVALVQQDRQHGADPGEGGAGAPHVALLLGAVAGRVVVADRVDDAVFTASHSASTSCSVRTGGLTLASRPQSESMVSER